MFLAPFVVRRLSLQELIAFQHEQSVAIGDHSVDMRIKLVLIKQRERSDESARRGVFIYLIGKQQIQRKKRIHVIQPDICTAQNTRNG